MKVITALLISFLTINLAEAAEWTLNSDTLICQTQEQLVEQMKYFEQENHTYAPGSGATDRANLVDILDSHLVNASKVRLLETGVILWAMSNGLSR